MITLITSSHFINLYVRKAKKKKNEIDTKFRKLLTTKPKVYMTQKWSIALKYKNN